MAGGPGFEPGLPGPEPEVLPLNYPPVENLRESYLKLFYSSIHLEALAKRSKG